MLRPDELIVDNFAGGGGASTGIEEALGRPVEPKADGTWFLTHSVEIDRSTLPKRAQEAAA